MHIRQPLYDRITTIFPRPCADILVRNVSGQVLLMFRANQPFKGQWWFPGGRVHFKETRMGAATRKLHEECAISTTAPLKELGTHDLFFSADNRDYHDITTLFLVCVPDNTEITIDSQASDFGWFDPDACGPLKLHPYVQQSVSQCRGS
jgi:colanic acid biosynthesis protein WcaH